MKNSMEDNGAEQAIKLGLDDLEAITGGELIDGYGAYDSFSNKCLEEMIKADKRGDFNTSRAIGSLINWAEGEKKKFER